VLHFGVSNFSVTQTALIQSRTTVTINQVQASIVHLHPFTDGTFDQCQQFGIIPMAWSPVGGGNIFNAYDERSLRILEIANALAPKYALGADQILLSWLITHPAGIRPVIGTAKMERISAAVIAAETKLDREDWFLLWSASTGVPVP
jgi:predicted oxidoreductase